VPCRAVHTPTTDHPHTRNLASRSLGRYGVQMDQQVGKNNGTVGLISYFRTKPLHGVFVRQARLEKIDDSAAQLALRSNLSSPYTPNS